MRKKIISLFLLLIMLLSPVVLSGCIMFGGLGDLGDSEGDSGSGGSGGSSSGEEELDRNDPSNFLNCFTTVKAVQKLNMKDASTVGSQAYVFTTQVMNQVDLISTEILIRLCGHFGMGLSSTLAATYNINLAEDIVPEAQSYQAIHDKANSFTRPWAWKHVSNPDVWQTYFPNDYVTNYLAEYEAEGKLNYKNELVRNVYNVLVGELPADTNEETLRNVATKFDHLGFTESEQQKLADFVLNTIIGKSNVEYDSSQTYNNQEGYYGYARIVPKIIKASVERVIVTLDGTEVVQTQAYPLYTPVLFEEKSVEEFGMELLKDESPFACGDGKAYDSLVLGTRYGVDVKGFTISFEIDDERITEALNLDIYAKYQYNGTTVRAKLTKTVNVNIGAYNINENANDVTIEFKPPSADDFEQNEYVQIDPSSLPDNSKGNEFYEIHNLTSLRLSLFDNKTLLRPVHPIFGVPLGEGELYSTVNDTKGYRKYFDIHEENGVRNVEYVDEETSYIQLFFKFDSEINDINFKIGFMDINIAPVL